MLSVIVITKNEAESIRDCLDSVTWADEIVVVDSGSTDGTVEICRQYTDKIRVTDDWPGFGPQKNRALEMATGDWVLSLDADEKISPELRAEIEAVLNSSSQFSAFRIPRLSEFCGRFMRHSGWWPDYVTRLVRREQARFSDDLVHERLLVEGTTGTLQHPILHASFQDLNEVLHKLNAYSTAGARMMHQRRRNTSLFGAVSHGLWTFIRTYILRAGFLDGREGFMLAVSNAEGTYYRYLKLMLLAEKQ